MARQPSHALLPVFILTSKDLTPEDEDSFALTRSLLLKQQILQEASSSGSAACFTDPAEIP